MESIISNLFYAVLSALFGVVLGWFASDPDRIPKWIAARRWKWDKVWWCIWQHPDDLQRLVFDEVHFSMAFGTVKFKVVAPGDEFHWEGKGKIAANYLIGEFRSIKARSTAKGSFTFELLPQGDRMVGYFTGPTTKGGVVANAGVFTSDQDDVKQIAEANDDAERFVLFGKLLRPAAILSCGDQNDGNP